MKNGLYRMSRHTTITDNNLIDQLIYEFITKCNYVPNKALEKQLRKYVDGAVEVCKSMKVDPKTYIDAQVFFAPVLRGYQSLTPQQLCSKDSKNYVLEYIAKQGNRDYKEEFITECRMLGSCLDSGWPERMALLNSTLDFSPWFRILICSTKDEEIIKKYGRLAAQVLNNDKGLVAYLKTIKSPEGKGLDFTRIPEF